VPVVGFDFNQGISTWGFQPGDFNLRLAAGYRWLAQ
jgi:hypothetical protein